VFVYRDRVRVCEHRHASVVTPLVSFCGARSRARFPVFTPFIQQNTTGGRYFCCPSSLTVADPEQRTRFRRTVKTSELLVKLGGWAWSPTTPRPPMHVLLRAPFWTEERYAETRASFLTPRVQLPRAVGTDADVAVVAVPTGGEEERLVVAYKAEGAVPARAEEVPIALAVVEVRADSGPGWLRSGLPHGRHDGWFATDGCLGSQSRTWSVCDVFFRPLCRECKGN
jgi:hypothetical protein